MRVGWPDGAETGLDALPRRRRGPPSPRSACRAPGSGKPSCRCPIAASSCAAMPWPASSTPGSAAGSSSRPARRPSGRSRRTRSGCGYRARRWSRSGRARRWARSSNCCAGVSGSPPLTCQARRCGSGCCAWPARARASCSCPVNRGGARPPPPDAGDEAIARYAGLNLARQVPDAADWLAGLDGPLVLGNYVYADGAANVAVCAAADALTVRLQAARDDVALAFLATPTDVYAVPSTRSPAPSAPTRPGRPPRSWPAGRCTPRPAGGCFAGPTRQAPTPASATPWSPSKARTMPWRNGCSGGGPPSPARPGQPCRSTSPRPPGPGW